MKLAQLAVGSLLLIVFAGLFTFAQKQNNEGFIALASTLPGNEEDDLKTVYLATDCSWDTSFKSHELVNNAEGRVLNCSGSMTCQTPYVFRKLDVNCKMKTASCDSAQECVIQQLKDESADWKMADAGPSSKDRRLPSAEQGAQ